MDPIADKPVITLDWANFIALSLLIIEDNILSFNAHGICGTPTEGQLLGQFYTSFIIFKSSRSSAAGKFRQFSIN